MSVFTSRTVFGATAKSALLATAAILATPAMAQSGQPPLPQIDDPNEAPERTSNDATMRVANPDNQGLGEIIVTATRRSENLQDVPVSISAIGAEQLASRGVGATADLGSVVPNLQVSSQYGETSPNFSLRGVGVTNEFAANTASPVGVYVDEVSQTFRYTQGLQLFDLDRVEVLRGPQGTLFGRNTTGGAVSIFTRQPQLGEANGYISAGYGNLDRYKLQGAFEFTPVEDTVGVRFAMTRGEGDGYFKEPNPGFAGQSSYGQLDTLGMRGTLRVNTGDLNISLQGFYAMDDPVGYPLHYIGLVGADENGRGGTDFFGSSRAGLDYDEVALDKQGEFLTESYGVSLNMTYNVNDTISLTSVTGYSDSKYILDLDNDATPLDVYYIDYNSYGKDFSQDLRLNFDTERFNGLIGVYYANDKLLSDNTVLAYNVLPDAPPGTTPAEWMPGVSNSFNVDFGYNQKRETYAVYAEGTYSLTDALEFTLGVRYTKDHVDFVDFFSTAITDKPGVDLFDIYGDEPPLLNSYDNWSGRAIVNYAWTDDIKTYASYSRGYRSGTYNGFGFVSRAAVYFVEPERLDSAEIGFKTRFLNDRLQLNGAGFRYDYKNQQTQEVIGGVAFLRSLDAEVYGAELEMLARPIPILTLRGALGYLDTEYQGSSPDLSGVPVSGNEIPFASKWTLSLGGDLTAAEFAGGSIVLSPEVSYKSSFFYDAFNDNVRPDPLMLYSDVDQNPSTPTHEGITDLVGSDGWWLVNGRISYIGERLSLSVWGKNILDEKYYPFGYDTAGAFGTVLLTPGAPRTYGVEATVKF